MKWFELIKELDTRLDRARNMGFDTGKVWYHATRYDFDRFVPSTWRHATYFADTPDGAIRGASAGAAEHPALSGPTTAAAKTSGLHIIPVYIKGKTWGRDPLPLDWFPEHITYGRYRAIIDGAEPVDVPGISSKANGFLNRTRQELMSPCYTEAVPEDEWEQYTGDNETNLPLKRDKLPIPKPMWSYSDVEGMDNYVIEALHALGFENWLVNDEGGVSIAVSNPANVRVKHASFDPVRSDSHAMNETVFKDGGMEYHRFSKELYEATVIGVAHDGTKLMQYRELTEAIHAPLAIGYHRTRNVERTKTIGETGFKTGGRALYGHGVYMTYDFEDQQDDRMKQTYGPFIIRAKVKLAGMLIFDPVAGKNVYNIDSVEGSVFYPLKLLQPQFERFGLPMQFLDKYRTAVFSNPDGSPQTASTPVGMDLTQPTSGMARAFFKKYGRKTKGMVFTGAQDGRVIVAYDPSAVLPFSWARVIDVTRTSVQVKWNKFDVLPVAATTEPVKVFPMAVSYFKRLGFSLVGNYDQHKYTDGGDLIGKFGDDSIIIQVSYQVNSSQWSNDQTRPTKKVIFDSWVTRRPDAAQIIKNRQKDINVFAEPLYRNWIEIFSLSDLPKALSTAAKSIFSQYKDMQARADKHLQFAKELLARLSDDAAFDQRQMRFDLPDQPTEGMIYGSDYRRDKIILPAGPVVLEIHNPYDSFAHGDVIISVGNMKLQLGFNDGSWRGSGPTSINAAYRMLLDAAKIDTRTWRQVLKTQDLPDFLSQKFRNDLLTVFEKNQ